MSESLVCESCGHVISDPEDSEEIDYYYTFGYWRCPNCFHKNTDE